MKYLTLTLLLATFFLQQGKAQTPGFHIESSHNVLFGDSMSNAGTKFMWIPSKGALRAGRVDGEQWDIDSIGNFSVAFGENNKVTGSASLSWGRDNETSGGRSATWGFNNVTSGLGSTTWGDNNVTSGTHSATWGLSNETSGWQSATWGFSNETSGHRSATWGSNNVTSGSSSATWGRDNETSGDRSATWGRDNETSGQNSATWGERNKNQSYTETVIGRYADTVAAANPTAWDDDDQLFVVGNGTADNARHNALRILKNGETTISDKLGIGTAVDPFFNFRLTIKESENTLIGYRDAAEITQWHTRLLGGTLSWSETGEADNRFVLAQGGKIGLNTATIDATADLQHSNGAKLTTTGIWTDASDISKKENISNLYYGLTEVLALNPVQYDYKVNKEASFGFIAQELEKILPELVFGQDGDKSVAYGQITAVLTKAIQEQQEIIQEQGDIIKRQKTKNSALENRLEKLESLMEAHFSSDK